MFKFLLLSAYSYLHENPIYQSVQGSFSHYLLDPGPKCCVRADASLGTIRLLSSSIILCTASWASSKSMPPSSMAGCCLSSCMSSAECNSSFSSLWRLKMPSSESLSTGFYFCIWCHGCIPPLVWFITWTRPFLPAWFLNLSLGWPGERPCKGFAVVILSSTDSL